MPLISFTASDRMLTKVLEAGYYPMMITEIDGPKSSKSGQSINWFFTVRITGGKYEGKELRFAFSNGTEQSSILGNLMWMPTPMMMGLAAAIRNVKVDEVPDQFDTDELLNKPFDGKVELNTGETGLFNTISMFIPSGKGAAASAMPF